MSSRDFVRPAHPLEPFPRAALERSIPERFAEQVARGAGRLALRAGGLALTYGELDARSNRLASRLLDDRGPGEEPIALLLPQGWAPVVALLGVLKAGKAYVPLDPAHPRARTGFIVRDTEAAVVVTDRAHRALARELAGEGARVIELEELGESGAPDPRLAIPPDGLAYVMYTSGSTGQPKGVMATHRTVQHEVLRITSAAHLARDDRQTLLRSIAFNGAARDVFGALLNGSSLHQIDLETAGLDRLADWLEGEGITSFRSVVSVFRHFAGAVAPGRRLEALRIVHTGGETVSRSDVELFKRLCEPGSVFLAGLGITEAGSVRHFFADHATEVAEGHLPVGYPVEDVEVLILSEDGAPAAPEQPGEIAVRSRYLSPGYWRRPDLTRARFLPDPEGGAARIYLTGDLGLLRPDGCLLHRGRRDFQVKVRGQRVELDEVEGALLALGGIRAAVVTPWDDGGGEPRLVAYLVPDGGALPTVGVLRRALAAALPAHMIPAAFVPLAAMPLTAMGKVDRSRLPAPPRARPALDAPPVAPRTPIERELAAIWADALGLDAVGVEDSFLELGGDSLRAGRIAARAAERLGVALSPAALFAAPTVAAMAVEIVQALLDAAEADPR